MNKESTCSLTTQGVWLGRFIGVFGVVVTIVWLFVGALGSDPDPTSGTLVQRVYEEIPETQPGLRLLAHQLVKHDQDAYEQVNKQFNKDREMAWIKRNYEASFFVPSSWFESVVATEGISADDLRSLLLLTKEDPLSTYGAARWLVSVSKEIAYQPAYEEQKEAIRLLSEALDKPADAP